MPANVLSGKQALVEYDGGQVASVDEWNLTVDVNMLDVTVFTTSTVQYRSFTPGLSGWTATISANFDSSSTGLTDLRTNTLTPATGTAILYMDKVGGEALQGDTFVSGMTHSAPIDGKVEVDFTLQGNGALTFSTTT